MEIITYIIEGELSHRDSTGHRSDHQAERRAAHVGRHRRGAQRVQQLGRSQCTCCRSGSCPKPNDLQPSYEDRTFPREEKQNQLRLIASHDGRDGSTRINQDASVYASLLDSGKTLDLDLQAGRHAWVQLVGGELEVNGTRLDKGDGAAISDESKLTLASVGGNGAAEFLLFDLA